MAQNVFDGAGDGDDRLAAAGGKGGVGAAGPVTDMPDNAGGRGRQGEDGGEAVRVNDVRAEVANDARQRAVGAQKGGEGAEKGKDA